MPIGRTSGAHGAGVTLCHMPDTGRHTWAEATRGHRDRQRESIAVAALELLSRHGGAGVSMAAVAEAAGVSRQTLYRYHRDLESVLVGVASTLTDSDEALRAEVLAEPDAVSRLRHVVDSIIEATTHAPVAGRSVEGALPPAGRELLRAHERRTEALIAEILRLGVEAGEFAPDLAPETDAPLVLGLVMSAGPDRAERVHALIRKILR